MKLKLEEVRQRIATALIAHNTNENNALSVANAFNVRGFNFSPNFLSNITPELYL